MQIRRFLVSVLVHTRNSSRTLDQLLNSIRRQTYKNIEIIVVDNNSHDNTKSIASRYTTKIYNFGPERSAQRNFAAKQAKGEYLLVPDSDMILDKNVIAECIDTIVRDPNIKAVVICEKSIGKGFWTKCKALERKCYEGDENIEAARFFEKNVFWEMGGYDENLTGPEDWDLPQRIKRKYKTGRIKSSILHDEGEVFLLQLAKKKYYYGLKVSDYIKKHPLESTAQQVIYLLRPAFYRNWRILLKEPIVTMGMVFMLSLEQGAGFIGFLKGGIFGKIRI
ncbi:MAG: glycosyltransferase [Candidatus Gottesmanbacteria bacterium]